MNIIPALGKETILNRLQIRLIDLFYFLLNDLIRDRRIHEFAFIEDIAILSFSNHIELTVLLFLWIVIPIGSDIEKKRCDASFFCFP